MKKWIIGISILFFLVALGFFQFNRLGGFNEIELESLLPYSRLINLSFIESNGGQKWFSISGRDQDAIDETEALLKQAGFVPAPFELRESN